MKSTNHDELLALLKARFEKNVQRHKGIAWSDVEARLGGNAKALQALRAMEDSGGEPDVVARDEASGHVVFCDCAAESPAGRRSLCFDDQALNARKENKPKGSALAMAAEMGIEVLTEEQ